MEVRSPLQYSRRLAIYAILAHPCHAPPCPPGERRIPPPSGRVARQRRCETEGTGKSAVGQCRSVARDVSPRSYHYPSTPWENLTCITPHRARRFTALGPSIDGRKSRSTFFDKTNLQSKGPFSCRISLTVHIVLYHDESSARRRLPQFAETVWGKGYFHAKPFSVRVQSHEERADSISQGPN
ncbi:hypothetical protein V2W45_1074732 [Cenococcum geophilum]